LRRKKSERIQQVVKPHQPTHVKARLIGSSSFCGSRAEDFRRRNVSWGFVGSWPPDRIFINSCVKLRPANYLQGGRRRI
jgi:hypothetical protein